MLGKYVVLEFWATWCTPCVRSIPHLNDLAEKFKDRDVQFVSITDEPQEKIETFLSKRELRGWVAIDNDKNTQVNYHVKGLPATFIVNTKGVIIYEGSPSDLTEELLDAIVSGNYIPITEHTMINTSRLGGWSGGQDPVITGNFDMDTMNYMHHEFIRKSVSSYPGSGWRQGNGEVGITILGMNLSEILAIMYDLPSEARVINESKFDNSKKWDILFSRQKGYDLEKGMTAIAGIITGTFQINIHDKEIIRQVWVPDYEKAKKLIPVKNVTDDDPVRKTYQLLSDICAMMEMKSGKIIACTDDAEKFYVDVFELGDKYYAMSWQELKQWLENKQNISFSTESRKIMVKVIADN